jgi:hypothetical protein
MNNILQNGDIVCLSNKFVLYNTINEITDIDWLSSKMAKKQNGYYNFNTLFEICSIHHRRNGGFLYFVKLYDLETKQKKEKFNINDWDGIKFNRKEFRETFNRGEIELFHSKKRIILTEKKIK